MRDSDINMRDSWYKYKKNIIMILSMLLLLLRLML